MKLLYIEYCVASDQNNKPIFKGVLINPSQIVDIDLNEKIIYLSNKHKYSEVKEIYMEKILLDFS